MIWTIINGHDECALEGARGPFFSAAYLAEVARIRGVFFVVLSG